MTALGIDAATVLYFVFGALGTFCRVLLSPKIDNKSVRMVVETVMGGVAGIVLPYVGLGLAVGVVGMDKGQVAAWPPIIKACIVGLVSWWGSFSLAEVLSRSKVNPDVAAQKERQESP